MKKTSEVVKKYRRRKSMNAEEQLDAVIELAAGERREKGGVVIGIDPGKTGSIAFVTAKEHLAIDIPTSKVKKAGKKTPGIVYDYEAIANILGMFILDEDRVDRVFVIVEQSQIGGFGSFGNKGSKTTGQGSEGGKGSRDTPTTAYNVAWSCAMYTLLLTAAKVRHAFVLPSVWKRTVGLLKQDKEASRLKAQRLYPQAELHCKLHHNRAEALLLASYAIEKFGIVLGKVSKKKRAKDETE